MIRDGVVVIPKAAILKDGPSSEPEACAGMAEWAIRVKDLRKQYPGRNGPVDAVNGIDLEIKQGECFGLLGPNGAGKTTTVEIVEGLNQPTSGEVEVLGMSWATDAVGIRERIGVTLQETRLPDKETVHEIVSLFRSFYKTGAEPEDVIARVALEGKANAFIEQLSGGQQQRLAVALALVGDPEVLFLDEPTTGLDPQSRRQLWDVIRDFRDRGRTIVLTTHYMDEAERLCDRVAIIDQGKIIAQGSPAELISRLGGDHIIEFALEESADGPDAGAELVAGARLGAGGAGRKRWLRLDGRPAASRDPGPARRTRPPRAAAGPLDDAAREPRGRLRRR